MAVLTVQSIALAGTIPTYAAPAALANEFANDGRTFLHVKRAGGGTVVVTLTTPGTIKGVAIADPTVTVGSGSEKMIGPFDPSIFNASDGNVDFACDATTGVTLAVVRLP